MTLTYEEAKAAAQEVVRTHGDHFRYSTEEDRFACFYVPISDPRFPLNLFDGTEIAPGAAITGCFVGEILKRTGYLTDKIAGSQLGITSESLDATQEALTFLASLQTQQDDASTWGDSLRWAVALIEETKDA